MRLKNGKILLVILISLGAFYQGCGGKNPPPLVDVCVVNVEQNGYNCVDKQRKPYFLAFAKSDNDVMLYPSDLEQLLIYCKVKKPSRQMVAAYVNSIKKFDINYNP